MQCKYKRKIEVRSRNHCCRRKAIIIPNSECVSAAFVTNMQCTRAILYVLLTLACPALPYFSHYLTIDTIFGKCY